MTWEAPMTEKEEGMAEKTTVLWVVGNWPNESANTARALLERLTK